MNKTNTGKIIPWACIVPIVATLGLAACGGGSSSSATTISPDGEALSLNTSAARSLEVPTEISAIPTSDSSTNAPSAPRSFRSAIRSAARAAKAAELPVDSDYHLIKKKTYVEERTLEVFDIIETVLSALGQTNYQDEVNNGPYKAVVAWEDNEGGRDVKQLQEWIVDSRLIVAEKPDGTTGDVLRALAWIEETDEFDGSTEVIKAEFRIYTGPTEDLSNPGAYVNFGSWDLNVYFDADANAVDATDPRDFFVAEARITDVGSTLKINNHETIEFGGVSGASEGAPQELNLEVKAILAREGLAGFGQVSFPDEEACWNPQSGVDCGVSGVPIKIAKYAYNADYLAVQGPGENEPTFKDRDLLKATPMVHRYGIFHKEADTAAGIAEGDNALRHKSFGFPVTYNASLPGSSNTFEAWGYYGAWQGRHELWGPEEGIVALNADGANSSIATVFTKQDFSSEASNPPTYFLREFSGTLSKRDLVDATPADIIGIPVETWLNRQYDLIYRASGPSGAGWYACKGDLDWSDKTCWKKGQMGAIAKSETLFGAPELAELIVGTNDRRYIDIGGNSGSQQWVMYIYEDADTTDNIAGGFFPAQWGQDGLAKTGDPALIANDGDLLNVNLGGSIYIKYVGFDASVQVEVASTSTGWVQMPLADFDEETWMPTFGASTAFTPDRNAEYYMNANGVNYIVKRNKGETNSADDYDVKLELQTAAHPGNTDATNSILPVNTAYLAEPWNQDVKYELVEDPSDAQAEYLLVRVQSIEPNAPTELSVGDILYEDKWGLVAFNSNNKPLKANGDPINVDEWGFPDPTLNNGEILRPVEFNWEYADDQLGETWGKQRFLVSTTDTSAYKILDNPISLTNVKVVDANSVDAGTVSVQYDGWMQGMPNLYFELSRNGWQMNDDIRNKVVIIQDGTKVVDSEGTFYFVRPLETSIFLKVLSSDEENAVLGSLPEITAADVSAVDVSDITNLPSYSAHNMDGIPTVDWDGNALVTKYSEGKPIN